jgi:hypothetical protein
MRWACDLQEATNAKLQVADSARHTLQILDVCRNPYSRGTSSKPWGAERGDGDIKMVFAHEVVTCA